MERKWGLLLRQAVNARCGRMICNIPGFTCDMCAERCTWRGLWSDSQYMKQNGKRASGLDAVHKAITSVNIRGKKERALFMLR